MTFSSLQKTCLLTLFALFVHIVLQLSEESFYVAQGVEIKHTVNSFVGFALHSLTYILCNAACPFKRLSLISLATVYVICLFDGERGYHQRGSHIVGVQFSTPTFKVIVKVIRIVLVNFKVIYIHLYSPIPLKGSLFIKGPSGGLKDTTLRPSICNALFMVKHALGMDTCISCL